MTRPLKNEEEADTLCKLLVEAGATIVTCPPQDEDDENLCEDGPTDEQTSRAFDVLEARILEEDRLEREIRDAGRGHLLA